MVLSSEEERKNNGFSYKHQTHKKPPDCSEGFSIAILYIIDLPMGLHYPCAPNL